MRRLLIGFAILAAGAFALKRSGSAHGGSHGALRSSALGAPRVDVLDDGKVVISSVAGGDLAGLVTLTLSPVANGAYAGQWAFTVANVDHTDPATGVEPEGEHTHEEGVEGAPHQDFVRLVNRGALAGTVGDASLTFGPEGLTALSANLTIGQGSQEFAGAQGAGSATLTQLSLTF